MRTSFVPVYEPLPSPLHTAGAGVTLSLCAALGLVPVLFVHPLVLAAVSAAVLLAAQLAGVGARVARSLRALVPMALLVALINPLVSSAGSTLLVRGDVVLGHRFDITLEAVAYGAFAGLRVLALGLVFALSAACVDQDAVLRLFRRVSHRSALTAALATRLVPVLGRDAARLSDAARCRPRPPGRFELVRAALSGALERAIDVAAALDVRGYSTATRPARAPRRWSGHDRRVAAAAALVLALTLALRLGGGAQVSADPVLEMHTGEAVLAYCLLLPAVVAIPFLGRAARLGVQRA
jgi:energy-coupling factor transport system permease protein